METLPAVYIIFSLLNAFRRGIPRQDIWQEFHRQGIAMRPRLSFWLALCRQAHLIEEYSQGKGVALLRVTRFVPQWLALPPDAQAFHLLEAWQNAPKNKGEKRFRRKLLWKLQGDKPLTQKDLRSINGLQALGLCQGANLTTWGKLLIKGEGTYSVYHLYCLLIKISRENKSNCINDRINPFVPEGTRSPQEQGNL